MGIRVHGRFGVEGDGPPIEHAFRDDAGNLADGIETFFPIVSATATGPWRPVATGFFISNNGLFATAKHVVTETSTGAVLPNLMGVQLIRREKRIVLRDVVKLQLHPTADVAVRFLYDKKFAEHRIRSVDRCFALTERIPVFGSNVATIAFPWSTSIGDLQRFEMRLSTEVSQGIIQEYYPAGRDSVLLPGRCARTTMDIPGGASGGPMVSEDGCVFALNSTGI
jgi:S1-C subfamily serine protease